MKNESRITVEQAKSPLSHWPAPAAGPRMVEVTAAGRRLWDDGEVRCGDIMYQLEDVRVSRRLCGGCSQAEPRGDGCGDLLERRDDG